MPREIEASELRAEILSTFPLVDMPSQEDLSLEADSCHYCRELAADLEERRGKPIGGEAIRFVHQELYHLSAKGCQWILPRYLRYCLTEEASYNAFETEYLIYSLGPDLEFQADTQKRLSLLSRDQVACLVDFLAWCRNQPPWREHCPEEIDKAIEFLRTML
jgi:hypothetical protein